MELITINGFTIFKEDNTIYVPQYMDSFCCTFAANIVTFNTRKESIIMNLNKENNEFINYFSDLKCATYLTNNEGKIFYMINGTFAPDQMYKTMRVSKTEMVNITPSDTYFAIIHNNCEYYQIGPSVRECYKTMNTLSVRRGRPVYNTSDYSFAICPFNARKIMVQFITDDKLYFAESANMLYWAKPQNFAVIMNRQGCAMITGARRYYQTLNEFMDAKIYNPCDFIKTDDTWSNSSYTISVNTKYNKNIQFVKIFNEDKTQILGVSLSKCIMSWYTLKNE